MTSVKLYLLLSTLLLLLPSPLSASTKCDTSVMRSFRLSGLKYSVPDRMKICPTVFERCCSISDEINILKLWKDYSEHRLDLILRKLYLGIRTIANYSEHLRKFTENDIVVNSINYRWIHYRHRSLEQRAMNLPFNRRMVNLQFNTFLPGRGRVRKLTKIRGFSRVFRIAERARARVALIMYLAALAKTVATTFHRYEAYIEWLQSESSVRDLSMHQQTSSERKLILSNFKKAIAKDVIQRKREIESRFEKLRKAFEKSPATQTLIPDLQTKYQNKFVKLLDEMKLFMNDLKVESDQKDYIQRIKKAQDDIHREMVAVEKILVRGTRKARKLGFVEPKEKKAAARKLVDEGAPEHKSGDENPTERKLVDQSAPEPKMVDEPVSEQKLVDNGVPERKLVDEAVAVADQLSELQSNNATSLQLVQPSADSPPERMLKDRQKKRKSKGKYFRFPNLLKSKRRSQKRRRTRQSRVKTVFRQKRSSNRRRLDNIDENDPRVEFWETRISPRFQAMFLRLMAFRIRLPSLSRLRPIRPPRVRLPINFSHQVMRTRTRRRWFMRGLLLTNVPKIKFCFHIHETFQNYPHEHMLREIEGYYPLNKEIMGLKKTLYCYLCDANNNRNFVKKAGLIIMEEEFCLDMIERYNEYLRWKHVKLVQYFDMVYQYLSCLESDGSATHFPFRSFLDRYKRRIDFYNRCLVLGAERSQGFMAACHFLCTDFKLHGLSASWDADLRIVRNMLFILFNSIRRQRWAPDEQITSFKMLLENDLSFDDRWTTTARDVEWDPPGVGPLPDPLEGVEGIGSGAKRKLQQMASGERDRQMLQLGREIDELQNTLSMYEKKSVDRGANEQLTPQEKKIKGQKMIDLLSSVQNLETKLKEFPDQVHHNPILGQRPDLIGPPDHQDKRPKKKAKTAKKPEKEVVQQAVPSVKKKLSEADLLAQLKTHSASPKLSGRKLQDSLPQKKPTPRANEVAEDVYAMGEFYEKQNNPVDIAHYRSFFTTQTAAMHPMRMSTHLNFFTANITDLLLQKYRSMQTEGLARTAISAYLKATNQLIHDFNTVLLQPVVVMHGRLRGSYYELAHQQNPLPKEHPLDEDDLPDDDEDDEPKVDEDEDAEEKSIILPPGSYSMYNVSDTNNLDPDDKLSVMMTNKRE